MIRKANRKHVAALSLLISRLRIFTKLTIKNRTGYAMRSWLNYSDLQHQIDSAAAAAADTTSQP